jgi:hypothetical protein
VVGAVAVRVLLEVLLVVAVHFRKQFQVLLSLYWFRLGLPVRAAPPRVARPGVSVGASNPIARTRPSGPCGAGRCGANVLRCAGLCL